MEEKEELLEQDESSLEKLSFSLENFSGPLDLLLALIKKNKLEIEEDFNFYFHSDGSSYIDYYRNNVYIYPFCL